MISRKETSLHGKIGVINILLGLVQLDKNVN